MAKVHKTIEEAGKNLASAAPGIGPRYAASTARADWVGPASSPAAKANYEAGLAEAIAEGRRESRIMAVGDAKYKSGCKDKGAPVIGSRITAAIPIYKANFSGVLSAMNSASDAAPPRTRDPMANIDLRLKPVVAAAIAAKVR